jgi:SAM-dependent methyltransferase
MESLNRKPLQGVTNIIRFNWHFYAMALLMIGILLFVANIYPMYKIELWLLTFLIFFSILISLLVSYYVYDYSGFYKLSWLPEHLQTGSFLNIHAGFDETSALLIKQYPHADWHVLDFYNPILHTEVSIKRARKRYPTFIGTKSVNAKDMNLMPNSIDAIFIIFAAHEIRNYEEQVLFFKQLQQSLTPNGKIFLVEHTRDFYNFLAFNIGFFHFFSANRWKRIFKATTLQINHTCKINPFVTKYVLTKHGTTS